MTFNPEGRRELEKSLRSEYGSKAQPIERVFHSESAARKDIKERYEIDPPAGNPLYWEELSGAALLDQERLESMKDSRLAKTKWALDQEQSSGIGLAAGEGAGFLVGSAALLKYGPEVFFDGVYNMQDAAGIGVAASTVLLAYAGTITVGNWNNTLEGFEVTREIYDSVVDNALENIEDSENYLVDHSGDIARYIEAVETELNYADPEVRSQIEVPPSTEDEPLQKLVNHMENLYQENHD